MIQARKNGRHIYAMVLNEPVNDVAGIVQCAIRGCEAHLVLMDDHGDPHRPSPHEQIDEFMMGHDCDPKRFKRA